MTSHSTDEVKAERMLYFHPSTVVNLKLWMMNSSTLKKGSCPLSLTAKTCPFGSWVYAQPSNTSVLCQSANLYSGGSVPVSSYKALSPAAFRQHTREQRNRAADRSKGRMWQAADLAFSAQIVDHCPVCQHIPQGEVYSCRARKQNCPWARLGLCLPADRACFNRSSG